MTKRQREQVVELLRCGADAKSLVRAGYALGHCDLVNPCSKVYLLADEAYTRIHRIPSSWYWVRCRMPLLEAAQRVEDGSWP